jgi:hypothetical protein
MILGPLLIGQGANDVRVRAAESERIVAATQRHGIPVTYIRRRHQSLLGAAPWRAPASIDPQTVKSDPRVIAAYLGSLEVGQRPLYKRRETQSSRSGSVRLAMSLSGSDPVRSLLAAPIRF